MWAECSAQCSLAEAEVLDGALEEAREGRQVLLLEPRHLVA